MNLYDRVLIRSYLKAYLVVLVSLLSLYVVVDLFTNFEAFTDSHRGLAKVLTRISTYYAYRITHIFDRLCEAIVMLAAMFTVSWMQKSNELAPFLSAGVSTRRVVRPVLITAFVMLGLSLLNQEFVIPPLSGMLLSERDDPTLDKELQVHGASEPNGIKFWGHTARRKQKMVKQMGCLIPETLGPNLFTILSEEAYYFGPGESPYGGPGWLLTHANEPAALKNWENPRVLKILDPKKYFLYTEEVDFDRLTRNRGWFIFASTFELLKELNRPESNQLTPLAVLFHTRLTRPLLGFLLVLMALAVILRDQNRNVFISAGLCLALCALFFAVGIACKYLGENEYLSPVLAAWLPVVLFGPFGVVLFDAMHT